MIAAANFTYLIGICMPNIAAWLLRRDMPDVARPYRAPRGTITLGVIAASIWLIAAILGFQQFGLPTVVFGLVPWPIPGLSSTPGALSRTGADRVCQPSPRRFTSSSPAPWCWC